MTDQSIIWGSNEKIGWLLIIHIFTLVVISQVVMLFRIRDYPMIGHDYRLEIQGMLVNYFNDRINGLGIQMLLLLW